MNNYKERVTHTIDFDLSKKFNKITKDNAINKSALIEKLIKKWIIEHEKMD